MQVKFFFNHNQNYQSGLHEQFCHVVRGNYSFLWTTECKFSDLTLLVDRILAFTSLTRTFWVHPHTPISYSCVFNGYFATTVQFHNTLQLSIIVQFNISKFKFRSNLLCSCDIVGHSNFINFNYNHT